MKKWFALLVFILCLTSCSAGGDVPRQEQPKGNTTNPDFIFMSNSNIKGTLDIYTVKDRETGYEYLLLDGSSKGEMTPRIQKDGSLYKRESTSYSTKPEFILISITEIKGFTDIFLIRDLVTEVEYIIYDGSSKGSIHPRIKMEKDVPLYYSY